MVELPTFYQWIFKIALILFLIGMGLLAVWIDKVFPNFKKTLIFRYIIKPIIYIIGIILMLLFIA